MAEVDEVIEAGAASRSVYELAGGWWLVAGGWWLVAGGWWLVAGEGNSKRENGWLVRGELAWSRCLGDSG